MLLVSWFYTSTTTLEIPFISILGKYKEGKVWVHFCIKKLIKVCSINVAALHHNTCTLRTAQHLRSIKICARYVLHNTCDPSRYVHITYCATLVLRTTDALTPTKCAHWRALFGLLPSGSCLLDLKCLYNRQGCVNETQHLNVSQPSFLWCCSKLKFMTYLLPNFFFFDIMTELVPLNA